MFFRDTIIKSDLLILKSILFWNESIKTPEKVQNLSLFYHSRKPGLQKYIWMVKYLTGL